VLLALMGAGAVATILALMGAGAVVLTLGVAGYIRWLARQRVGSVLHHARCPKCSQKVRYAAARAGRQAICPRCKLRFTLPATPQPVKPLEVPARLRRPVSSPSSSAPGPGEPPSLGA
jgi:hypothetical protein